MKTRNGWVSNSSSSSFIIATVDNTDEVKVTITIPCDVLKTETEDYDHFYDMYYDKEGVLESEDYQLAIKAIKDGKVLKLFTASDDGDDIESGLRYHNLTQDMIGQDSVIIQNGDY